jgi:hypothetical protein
MNGETNVVYPYNEVLCSLNKEGNAATQMTLKVEW